MICSVERLVAGEGSVHTNLDVSWTQKMEADVWELRGDLDQRMMQNPEAEIASLRYDSILFKQQLDIAVSAVAGMTDCFVDAGLLSDDEGPEIPGERRKNPKRGGPPSPSQHTHQARPTGHRAQASKRKGPRAQQRRRNAPPSMKPSGW